MRVETVGISEFISMSLWWLKEFCILGGWVLFRFKFVLVGEVVKVKEEWYCGVRKKRKKGLLFGSGWRL